MSYYPSSQIKPNQYTNGGEYILSTTKENYKGYYYELSNGRKYTGKSPQDKPNILLSTFSQVGNTPQPPLPLNNNNYDDNNINLVNDVPTFSIILPNGNTQEKPYPTEVDTSMYFLSNNFQPRSIPSYNPTTPTPLDYNLGVFSLYFCKKINELKYIEIDKNTYSQLLSKSPQIAWDLYTPLTTLWYLKGEKEKVYTINKNLITLIEKNQKWYGFSQYFKDQFSKYYLES
jgi:hypothetical protein